MQAAGGLREQSYYQRLFSTKPQENHFNLKKKKKKYIYFCKSKKKLFVFPVSFYREQMLLFLFSIQKTLRLVSSLREEHIFIVPN